MSDTTHEQAHTGPIKTPKQLFWASFAAFVVPVFIIIGLVYFVASSNKTAPGAYDAQRDVALRLQKVGTIEIRDANRPLQSGEQVYTAQCAACHATGVSGAPKFQDAAEWGPRLGQGYEALLTSALKGKGAMAPQGGGNFSDLEIGRAVVYMANAGGGKLAEPEAPASDAAASGDAAPADAAPADTTTPVETASPAAPAEAAAPATPPATPAPTEAAAATTAETAAPATAVAAATPAAAETNGGGAASGAAGKALYEKSCMLCHGSGVAGAPKLGDKAAWDPRIAAGMDEMLKIAINGKGAMPPRGASTASDDELKAAVQYMVDAVK
ncbi:c-type cytochrome [Ottowia sp.]|uniref:c-type cytochrome n=1 Tax=Ottowia sp. TaxID=1898956 RepID=UPI003A897166